MINILLIASIFGFVLSTTLFLKKSTHTQATLFLGGFYFILSVYALQTYIIDGGNLDKYRWFFLWPLIPYNAIFIPIYYYFHIILNDRLQWKKRQVILFVPMLLAIIDVGYIYLQPGEVYADIINDANANPENRLNAKYWLLDLTDHALIRHFWQLGVVLVLLPGLVKFIKFGKEDRLKRVLNKWLMLFWVILLIMAVLVILYVLGRIMGANNPDEGIVTLITYLVVLLIGIFPIYFPSILHGYPQTRTVSQFQKDEMHEPGLKYGLEGQAIEAKLELLNQRKLFLEQNFDLTKYSQEMDMPAHHISYFLKNHYGLSFSSYKNNLRMEYAKKLIEAGFLKNNTIEALAGECGFASRTSFSKAFKNTTDISPSQYALKIK